MPTDKQRFSITVDDNLYRKIEDFRFERRIKSQSKAVNALMEIGFDALMNDKVSIGPSLSSFELSIVEKYNSLDAHGKKVIDLILKEEYERCAASPVDPVIEEVKKECEKMDAEKKRDILGA